MLNYLMRTGNISETDEMKKIIHDKWVKVFIRYVNKGDHIFLIYWNDEVSYLPTPHLDTLINFAEECTENVVERNETEG